MSDRIAELLRQRALLQEHLAWLDREIAAAHDSNGTAARTSPERSPFSEVPSRAGAASPVVSAVAAQSSAARAPAVSPRAVPESGATGTKAAASQPQVSMDQYRVSPAAVREDVKKGCFLYFALALGAVVIAVTILWFAFRE